jgi:hypothetical protein
VAVEEIDLAFFDEPVAAILVHDGMRIPVAIIAVGEEALKNDAMRTQHPYVVSYPAMRTGVVNLHRIKAHEGPVGAVLYSEGRLRAIRTEQRPALILGLNSNRLRSSAVPCCAVAINGW